jgi:FAD-dependent urate hydroxylase
MSGDEVLVIGAGPNGLSISAHLRALDISHRIVGRPLESWRAHMPARMMLRSEPYGSDIAAPDTGYDVGTYSRQHGIPYVDRVEPISVEQFLDYGTGSRRNWSLASPTSPSQPSNPRATVSG